MDSAIIRACDYRMLITYKDASNLLVMWFKLSLQLAAESIYKVYLASHRANSNMHPCQARAHSRYLIIRIMIRHQKQLLYVKWFQRLLLHFVIQSLHMHVFLILIWLNLISGFHLF